MIFIDWYEPGYKAGGPIRSIVNFVNQMQESFDLWIFTSDRDLNEQHPYTSVILDQWISAGNSSKILYASPGNLNFRFIKKQVDHIKPDFIYLNSMFSPKFTMIPLMVNWVVKSSKVILAPRGMLKNSALSFKPFKKKFFLKIFSISGISKKIWFHATDPSEVVEIENNFGKQSNSVFIPNFSAIPGIYPAPLFKSPDQISIAFIGRVHPVKNLLFLIEILKGCNAKISLDIVGDIEDENYYKTCKEACSDLGDRIEVKFHGSQPSSSVENILLSNHIMVLPTLGENFGHSLFESLAMGKPIITSDNTPWKDLEKFKAGFDIPLSDRQKFIKSIQFFAQIDNEEYKGWSYSAWKFVSGKFDNIQLKEKYIQLFS